MMMKASKGKRKSVYELFAAEALKPEAEIDLGRAALLIAKSEYPDLDPDLYLRKLDEIGEGIESRFQTAPADRSPHMLAEKINEYLFQELSYRGNADNYYDPKNSFLNEVLDRRVGIPITLSVLYIEVARRLGFNVEGVGMPGHFLVKYRAGGEDVLIDPFNGGRRLSEADCEQLISGLYGQGAPLQPSYLCSVSKRDILTRMLGNLKNIYISGGDNARALTIVERILMLNPDSLTELRDRGLINFALNRLSAALMDLEDYLSKAPEGPEADSVRQYIMRIKSKIAMLN
jgi:regulator of sirC expression with transglutaminase-like and TPR domain